MSVARQVEMIGGPMDGVLYDIEAAERYVYVMMPVDPRSWIGMSEEEMASTKPELSAVKWAVPIVNMFEKGIAVWADKVQVTS